MVHFNSELKIKDSFSLFEAIPRYYKIQMNAQHQEHPHVDLIFAYLLRTYIQIYYLDHLKLKLMEKHLNYFKTAKALFLVIHILGFALWAFDATPDEQLRLDSLRLVHSTMLLRLLYKASSQSLSVIGVIDLWGL